MVEISLKKSPNLSPKSSNLIINYCSGSMFCGIGNDSCMAEFRQCRHQFILIGCEIYLFPSEKAICLMMMLPPNSSSFFPLPLFFAQTALNETDVFRNGGRDTKR